MIEGRKKDEERMEMKRIIRKKEISYEIICAILRIAPI